MIYYERNSDPKYYEEHRRDANCGSYALQLQGWYDPEGYFCDMYDYGYVDDTMYALLDDGYSEDEINELYADTLVEGMLIEFDGELRLLSSITEKIKNNEELIGFRTFAHWEDEEYVHYDFHFKVFRNGKWMEKHGPLEVNECEEQDWGEYDSKTYYFAHKIIEEEKVA